MKSLRREVALESVPRPVRTADGPWITRFAPLSAVFAILLIFLLLSLLLWLLDRDERAAHRDQLIRDSLWVEQALRFQFESEQIRLERLVRDISEEHMTPAMFGVQTRQYLQILPELEDIFWLDDQQRVVVAERQRGGGETQPVETAAPALLALAVARAGKFTQPWVRLDGRSVIAFVSPIVRDDGRHGGIVVVFALDAVLAQHVPWWIAEKRAVNLKDTSGNILATRSGSVPDPDASAYSIDIGPPLHELRLTLMSYRQRSGLMQNSLVVSMVALGFFAAAGLVARERQLRKRHAAEAALDKEYAFRKAMESSLLVGIRARDLEGRVLYANQAFCRMVGYSLDELVGALPPMPYWVPEQFEFTQRIHDAVLAGETIGKGIELKFRHREGRKFDVLIYEAPLLDARGVQLGWMGSVLDISDRKRAEEFAQAQAERMQHSTRLIMMGEMASLLAHDLNQPLAAICSYQTGLENRVAMDDLTREEISTALRGIGASAERAGSIVRRVHEFVKKREPRLERQEVGTLIAEALALLRPEIDKMRTRTELNVAANLPAVRADSILIQQVLINLIKNGLDALNAVPDDSRLITISAQRCMPNEVEIAIADTGGGMLTVVADALFQPFVSTKPGGMGMGLTICRSIVELHGGRINYTPTDGGGARFAFTLPVERDPAVSIIRLFIQNEGC